MAGRRLLQTFHEHLATWRCKGMGPKESRKTKRNMYPFRKALKKGRLNLDLGETFAFKKDHKITSAKAT